MKIRAIETGKVRVTKSWRIGKGEGVGKLVHTLLDKEMTEWLPIYVWLIEHPEGLILIDTGSLASANDRVWFPPFMPLVQRAAVFDVSPEQEVGPQLGQLGYSTDDVRWVVMTHLHQDHDGGLHYFPKAEFIISAQEWAAATGLKGRLGGYLNQKWPSWFAPTLLDFGEKRPFQSFTSHHVLTQAADVHLVATPGHSVGHISVIVQDSEHSFFFAGDASYTDELLLQGRLDGIGDNAKRQQETYQQILTYASRQPTIYLPSHDPEGARRLDERAVLDVNKEAERVIG